MDQGGWVLARDHLEELRCGERSVEVQSARAHNRAGDRQLGEATVIAAHDCDAIALPDASRSQRMRQGIRATVYLREGHGPQFVDDRDPVRIEDRPTP